LLSRDQPVFEQPQQQQQQASGPFRALGGRGGLRVAGFNEINTPAEDDDDDDDDYDNWDGFEEGEDVDEDFADDFDAIDAQDPSFFAPDDSDSSSRSGSDTAVPAELFVRGRAVPGVDAMWKSLAEMQATATAAAAGAGAGAGAFNRSWRHCSRR
jgi:hypothetical protein